MRLLALAATAVLAVACTTDHPDDRTVALTWGCPRAIANPYYSDGCPKDRRQALDAHCVDGVASVEVTLTELRGGDGSPLRYDCDDHVFRR
jgi:hypothetical protein